MGKIVTVVLGIAVVVGGAYYVLNHLGDASTPRESSAAKRQLDNVHQAADRIESDADKRAQELDEKMNLAQ
ncbi:MAG TPA: hypothetical protein VF794_15485 [Archangium sp.]|jgi:hypothetical protein|uniref:hypothetical protein n=1 Tax=Archangium sp. TaxID=1872627 RepID=UPI002EDA78D6